MEAVQNVVASATHRNIWTRLGELHWPGRNYLRLAVRFSAASRKNGTAGGVWVPTIPVAADGAHGPNGASEGVGSGGPIVQDSGSNLPARVQAEVANLTPPEASMQAAVLFHSFRRAVRTWSETMRRLDEAPVRTNAETRHQLSTAHESAYREWAASLHKLLLCTVPSRTVVQMKVDAFCEYAEPHVSENTWFALYALLIIQDLTRLSGLNPAEVDRLAATCRGICAALGEMAGSSGTFLS